MFEEKKIVLKDNIFYIRFDLLYRKNDHGMNLLYKDTLDTFDGGDISILIEETEKNYTYEISKEYDKDIKFMGDVLYIYDNISNISGIRDAYYSKDKTLSSCMYISRKEIENYIKNNNVKMKNR